MTMRSALAAAVLGVVVLAGPVGAQNQMPAPAPTPEEAGEAARRAMEQLLWALELLIKSIPQYDAPVVNENGDIIIRRRNPPPKPAPQPGEPPELDETRT